MLSSKATSKESITMALVHIIMVYGLPFQNMFNYSGLLWYTSKTCCVHCTVIIYSLWSKSQVQTYAAIKIIKRTLMLAIYGFRGKAFYYFRSARDLYIIEHNWYLQSIRCATCLLHWMCSKWTFEQSVIFE